MRPDKSLCLVIVLLVISQCTVVARPQAAVASGDVLLKSTVETSSVERISEIDRTLVLSFIKLARFNIQFHQEANRHQPWRAFTYPAGRETGTAVGFASSVMDLRQRIRGLADPKRISKDALRNGLNTALVGTAISAGVSSLELAQNTWAMLQARKQGYSPRDSVNFVKAVVAKTNTLFAERERLVAGTASEGERKVFGIEDRLLHRIRQQLLVEFSDWSAHSREQAWRENLFYTIDAGQNYTRAGALMIALRGFRHPSLGGPSVNCTLIANSVATVNPLICMLAGMSVRKYQQAKLAHEFNLGEPAEPPPGESFSDVQAKGAQLQKAGLSETHRRMVEETLALSDKSERFDVVLNREQRDIERLRQIAQQQAISGPIIGLTGVAGTTMAAIAFYDYRGDRVSTNHLLLANRISVMSGQSLALIGTPCAMILGAIKKKHLAERGELPAQLLEERLKNLDVLERQIASSPRS